MELDLARVHLIVQATSALVFVIYIYAPKICLLLFFKGSSYNSNRNHMGRDKYGPPVRTEYRLIVENLSTRCSWQDLKVHLLWSQCHHLDEFIL